MFIFNLLYSFFVELYLRLLNEWYSLLLLILLLTLKLFLNSLILDLLLTTSSLITDASDLILFNKFEYLSKSIFNLVISDELSEFLFFKFEFWSTKFKLS